MNEQNFDNHLRDNLGDYRSKLDTEALWQQLEPQLAADKKRRRGFFWWWSGAGVLLALVVWGWYAGQNPQPLSAATEKAVESRVNPSPETAGSELANKPSTGENSAHTPHAASATEVVRQAGTTNLVQAPVLEIPKQPVSKLPKSAAKPSGKRNLPQATAPTTSTIQPVQVEATKLPVPQEAVVAAAQVQTAGPVSLLPWLEIKSLVLPEQRPPFYLLATTAAAPPKKNKPADLLIRPNFEMGYAFKTLEDRYFTDSTASSYLQVRRETEKALEYLHGSLLLGSRHRTGWYALTGLGYTRITEQFSFSTTGTERDSVEGITEIYINAEGDSIFTEGMVERTRHIIYRKRSYGSYTLLDVPLIVGFDREKGRWSFGAEAGVFFNISLKAKGDAVIENERIRLEGTNWFKPSVGLSYYGSIRVGYALDEKTRISLGPTFRYVPDISDPDRNNFVQKYGLLGVNIGIARRF